MHSDLRSQRLIKIYVADASTPYLVQEAVLTGMSEYFKRALANADSFGGEKDVMRFPEDDPVAWKVLLYWRIQGCLQRSFAEDAESTMMQLIRCWALGDKYDVKNFQDVIMLDLIQTLNIHLVKFEVVRFAFENTPDKSPLRKLMAQEAVISFYYPSMQYAAEDLEIFDGVCGFMTEFVKAIELKRQKEILATDLSHPDEWNEFMVGEGPMKHWVWDWCE